MLTQKMHLPLKFILVFINISLFNAIFWMKKEFGDVYPYEFLFYLQYGLRNIATINQEHYLSFFFHALVTPFFATITIIFFLIFINRSVINEAWIKLLVNWLNKIIAIKFLCVILILAIIVLLQSINIQLLINKNNEGDFFKNNYVPISLNEIKSPKTKKNLILIYVESLSAEYENIERYPDDLLGGLKATTENAYKINFKQATTNRWTMAGMFDSMCGLPLKISFGNRFKHKPRIKRWNEKANLIFNSKKMHPAYAPNVLCLGTILKNFGYQNIFMGGADLNFSGKGAFLKQHGYDQTYGKSYWESIGEKYFNSWGLHDDRLFFHAKQKILELHKNKQPFNFTMLTLNLHEPSGFSDRLCASKGYSDYKGLIKCTNDTLVDFVKFYKENNLSTDTDLVIIGDHNPRKSESLVDGGKTDHSLIFNRFITETSLKINRDKTFHFGIFPSLLSMMGFKLPNNQVGLESSFFGESINIGDNISEFSPGKLNESINSYSEYYTKIMYSN
jgi:phosphoglycerol transferase